MLLRSTTFDNSSEFLDPLRVEQLEGKWWQLTDSLRYWSAHLDREIVVPNGFVTNFASVPLLWNLHDRPSVVHDYMYRFTEDWTREKADDTYYEAMVVEDYRFYSRYPFWAGVRVGGWRSFGKLEPTLDPR